MGKFVDILKEGATKLATYAAGGGLGMDIIGQAGKLGVDWLKGKMNQKFAEEERARNFEWNEKAAKEADKRQRAQYNDLYSPMAMMEQYRAAGLSPSLMMSGGAPAVGGTAQGNQSAGISGTYPAAGESPNPLIGAQIANLMADTDGKEIDNALKEIRKNMDEIAATKAQVEFDLLSTYFNKDGKKFSFTDFAKDFSDFDEFKKQVFKQNLGEQKEQWLKTEIGENFLRSIFRATHELKNDIAVLSSSKMNAQVMEKVSRALYNSDFATQKKDALLKQLKEIAEGSELTATQKGAFNNLIEKLGDGTFKDIVIVLLMALSNFQKSQMNFDFGAKTTYAGQDNQVINQNY